MVRCMPPVIIKKYGNRRLYDTGESRYITLEELAARIQRGADVHVLDARTDEDLTQATLTQIVIESRNAAKMLPVPLLTQLIRLGDDALAEFLGRYVTHALELYLQAKRGLQTAAAYNPFAGFPFATPDAFARMFMGAPPEAAAPPPPPSPAPAPPPDDDLATMRREIDELKRAMQGNASGLGKPGTKRRSPKSRRD
jgi:polyhydroxyalkanoate synthesis repressor PhaR